MRRVAICISGFMRTYKKTYKSFCSNIWLPLLKQGFTVDIFISTWDKLNTNQSWNATSAGNTEGMDQNLDVEEIKSLYKPKEIVVESFEEVAPRLTTSALCGQYVQAPNGVGQGDFWFQNSMFYKIRVANQLKKAYEIKENITYDYCIRYRTDTQLTSPITNLNDLEPGGVYAEHINGSMVGDVFWVGANDAIDAISDWFHYLKTEFLPQGPEANLGAHCFRRNIRVGTFPIPIEFIRN